MGNKRALTYTKQEGKIELVSPIRQKEKSIEQHLAKPLGKTKIPDNYTKQDGTLSYSIVFVISGGTKREKDFLEELIKKHSFSNVDMIFMSSQKGEGGLTPNMMKKEYDKIFKNKRIQINGRDIILEDVDTIYMITDVDHYAKDLMVILNEDNDRQHPVWIISNPDFEIWIYYCFRNEPDKELKEVVDAEPSKRSSMMKTINGKLNHGGGLDPRKAFENIEAGITHSESHYKEEESGLPKLLSTKESPITSPIRPAQSRAPLCI